MGNYGRRRIVMEMEKSWEKILFYVKQPLQERLLHGFFWSFIGSVFSQLFGLVTSIVTARLLGRVIFGQVGAIVSTIGMLGTFAGFGLGMTATKHIAEFRSKDPERTGRIIGLTTVITYITASIVAITTFVFSSFIAKSLLNDTELITVVRISSLLLFFNSVAGIQIGILLGIEKFRSVASINIIIGLFSLVLECYGAWKFGLIGVIIAMVVVSGLYWLLNQIFVIAKCREAGLQISFHQIGLERKIVWAFSLPALLSGLLFVPITWVGNILLVNSSNGYAEMGVFSAANQWRMAIIFLPGVIGQTALPILSNLFGEQRLTSFKRVMAANLLIVFGICCIIALPIIVFSKSIMEFYGKSFTNGNIVLILICITAIFSSTASIVGSGISSMGKMWNALLLNAIWAIVFLVCTVVFREKGAAGLSMAYLISYLVHFILSILYAFLVMKMQAIKSIPLPIIENEQVI